MSGAGCALPGSSPSASPRPGDPQQATPQAAAEAPDHGQELDETICLNASCRTSFSPPRRDAGESAERARSAAARVVRTQRPRATSGSSNSAAAGSRGASAPRAANCCSAAVDVSTATSGPVVLQHPRGRRHDLCAGTGGVDLHDSDVPLESEELVEAAQRQRPGRRRSDGCPSVPSSRGRNSARRARR